MMTSPSIEKLLKASGLKIEQCQGGVGWTPRTHRPLQQELKTLDHLHEIWSIGMAMQKQARRNIHWPHSYIGSKKLVGTFGEFCDMAKKKGVRII